MVEESRAERRRKAREALPPEKFSGKNLRDFPALFEISGYEVAEWTPQDNGEGKPEAVAIQINMAGAFDGMSFYLRLKSTRAVDELVALLEKYRDQVWPDAS